VKPEDLVKEEKPILWIPIGVIGAGKTTFALKLWQLSPHRFLRVSLDDIVQMMSFYGYQKHLSEIYGSLESTSIKRGLVRGYQVYVDRTNLTKEIRGRFLEMVREIELLAKEALRIWETALEAGVDPREETEEFLSYTPEEPELKGERELREWLRHVLFGPSMPELIPGPSVVNDPMEHLRTLSSLEKVALYFEIDPGLALKRREMDPFAPLREITGRKIEWQEVLERMCQMLTPPKKEEGFTRGFLIHPDGRIEELF
jgi:hypothetical protein